MDMTAFLAAREALPSSRPSAFRLIWKAKAVASMVAKHGFAYLDIALYHPPVYRFLEMRQELGVRNVFHPIARLLNPARAILAGGRAVRIRPISRKTAEAFECWVCPRALVVSGVEGDPELSIAMATQGIGTCETSG